MSETPESKGVDALNRVLSILEGLPDEDRGRIIRAVLSYYAIGTAATQGGIEVKYPQHESVTGAASQPVSFSQELDVTPKAFIVEKRPANDVERIGCLAFYLTHYRDMPHFKTIDLSKLNTEAAQPKFANAAVAANNAVLRGYLVQAGGGLRQLSAIGEQFVRALPDREAAKRIMETAFKRKRARKPTLKPTPGQ
jgi:hypothetical protein